MLDLFLVIWLLDFLLDIAASEVISCIVVVPLM